MAWLWSATQISTKPKSQFSTIVCGFNVISCRCNSNVTIAGIVVGCCWTEEIIVWRMVISFVTYIKNRRIGSTYPSIDAKPDSQAKKTLRKLREAIAQKCMAIMKSMPFISPRVSAGLINIIELQGMFEFWFLLMANSFYRTVSDRVSIFSSMEFGVGDRSSTDSDVYPYISGNFYYTEIINFKLTTHFNFKPLATFFSPKQCLVICEVVRHNCLKSNFS